MSQTSRTTVLPTEAFDAIFRSEPLEERVEFQGTTIPCTDTYTVGCTTDTPPGMTVTPEPATMLMAAGGIAAVGVANFLRRRKAQQQSLTSNDINESA